MVIKTVDKELQNAVVLPNGVKLWAATEAERDQMIINYCRRRDKTRSEVQKTFNASSKN